MHDFIQINLNTEEVNWAIDSAKDSIKKWSEQKGHYNNKLNSHLTGKLGELAVEKYLLENEYDIDSHFRFPDREKLCDIVVKIKRYIKICRLEIKTWSEKYWVELGRCIAIDQYADLKKKADLVLWCVIPTIGIGSIIKAPTEVTVKLVGWSRIDEIVNAPVKHTGIGDMRKIKNYQLAETEPHLMVKFPTEITDL